MDSLSLSTAHSSNKVLNTFVIDQKLLQLESTKDGRGTETGVGHLVVLKSLLGNPLLGCLKEVT